MMCMIEFFKIMGDLIFWTTIGRIIEKVKKK